MDVPPRPVPVGSPPWLRPAAKVRASQSKPSLQAADRLELCSHHISGYDPVENGSSIVTPLAKCVEILASLAVKGPISPREKFATGTTRRPRTWGA
jgi:hypothetical protein